MSHPQPPFGPQDPNQPPPEPPTQPFPTAPMPPVSGAPYPPVPGAPQPPVSGTPYPPPVSGAPYPPPVSGAPYPPPVSGAPYPPAPGGAYPPGGPYPPATGYPYGAPQPGAPGSKKKVWLILGSVAAVLVLLCCAGGIFAIVQGAKKAEEVADSLPTPAATNAPADRPTTNGSEPTTERGATSGDTFNMQPGDTLVINDDDGTIEITVDNFRTSEKACQAYMPEPDEGMYLIADVTAEVTKGTGSINPFFFHWIAADGTETNGVGGAFSGCGKLLPSGNDLPTGSKRAGTVVFDVKDKNGTLEYEHRLKTAGSWKP